MTELLTAGRQVYNTLLNMCVWAKDNGGMGSFYRSQHELVFVYRNGKAQHRNNIQLGRFGRNRTNLWRYPGASTLTRKGDEGNLLEMHPTVKPVAMIADALLDCSAPGDIVLDSFLGSGSTLLAAERTRRVCWAMEIEPKYVDVAIGDGRRSPEAVRSTPPPARHLLSGSRPMDDYEVGYGKPPKTTRFAKGKSGNPSGRKKGRLNVVTIFHSVTQATITVTENGKTRSITKFEAMLMQMMNKAVAGDLRAMKEVLQWSHLFNQMPDHDAGDGPDTEKNSIVMNQFIEQIRNASIELEVAATAPQEEVHDATPEY